MRASFVGLKREKSRFEMGMIDFGTTARDRDEVGGGRERTIAMLGDRPERGSAPDFSTVPSGNGGVRQTRAKTESPRRAGGERNQKGKGKNAAARLFVR